MWPRLQRPLKLAPLQLLKSPSEGIGVLLRNKQLLGQNSLCSGVDRQRRCTTLSLIGHRTGRSSSRELVLGWLRRLLGSRAINSNKLVEDYLMCSGSCWVYKLWSIAMAGDHKRCILVYEKNQAEKMIHDTLKMMWITAMNESASSDSTIW